MATIQEILDKISASKSNNINNNSFIDLMRQISGNPEDAIQPVNDTNSIYGHIVQMYTTLFDGGIDYAVLADEVGMLQGVYDNLIAINSVHADKTKLDSLYTDKTKLDQLFADKAIIDRVYGSISNIDRVHTSIDKLDTVYASVLKMDTVADNIADVNTVADNIAVLNEIYDNRVEIYAADDNAVIATTKASEASASAATTLGYKNDVSAMKLAVETIYDTFDDRFLGTKAIDPILDNDGNALLDGAMYFNTSSNTMKVYDVGTTTWYSIPQIYLSGLLDVNLTSITSGNVLRWNGTKWINYTLSKADVGLNLIDNTADSAKNVLSATKLATARTIGGVTFDGTANINLPGVNIAGNQSTTGNAATATNLSTNSLNWETNGTLSATVGQLAWNNYGNYHTIFDASKGVTPTGAIKSNTTPDNPWSPSFPTLMGYNCTNTYGVRVDIAARSETCTGNAASATRLNVASTDNAIVRFNGTTGEVQNSGVIIDDDNNINAVRLRCTGAGNDYNTGAIEANGNGSTVFPNIGFHQPGYYAGTLQQVSGNEFSFHNQFGNYASLKNNINMQNAINVNGTVGASVLTSNVIVESGSNANGYYTKFANGSMIEYKDIVCAATANVRYQEAITWPISGTVAGTTWCVSIVNSTTDYEFSQQPAFNNYTFYFTANTTQAYYLTLTRYTP